MKPEKYPVFNFQEVIVWLLDNDDLKYIDLQLTLVMLPTSCWKFSSIYIYV